ncbi:DUF58 domain-containing protein [Natronosalvus amylolyticus]|uniref:DUF58 domain-containing protein n=1 Tax=Natronosalvus amylolyticus TaxID=2961994 RepID=UPI0020C9D3B0|nr:DUF58 domain-containing protein [Natronosalvus amylolyticus]
MRPTRRTLAVGGLVAFFTALAVLFAHPAPLVGAVGIGAWLCVRQYLFYRELVRATNVLELRQTPALTGLKTGESTTVTIGATLERPSSLSLSIEAGLPVSTVTEADSTLTLEPEKREATRTMEVSWPVAGRHEFEPARVTASDGLFTETLTLGSTPTVTVQPRGPRSIHVGSGGNRVPVRQGNHPAGKSGSGLIPAELREYMPGETAARIDWKATARLVTPHVRTYDAETDRLTVLVVDHSSTLATGPDGETQLDYLREVALLLAESAHGLGDPVGLWTVDESAITSQYPPSTGPIKRIRRRLLDLEAASEGTRTPRQQSAGSGDPTAAFRELRRGGDDSLTATLEPYIGARTGNERFETSGPALSKAVQKALSQQRSSAWVVLLTNDTNPSAVRRSVRRAREAESDVLVLLTPTVLFEPGELVDLEAAYERYLEFEEFRRSLDRLDRVTALEVAPDETLTTVLSVGRSRRGVTQ